MQIWSNIKKHSFKKQITIKPAILLLRLSGPRMRPIFGGLRLETNPNPKTNEREMQIKYQDIATNQTAVHVNTLEQYSNN